MRQVDFGHPAPALHEQTALEQVAQPSLQTDPGLLARTLKHKRLAEIGHGSNSPTGSFSKPQR